MPGRAPVAFAAFVDRAIAAGWRTDKVLTTIIELADNHALMLAADADLEGALTVLKKHALDSVVKKNKM